jgi:hypothetical protein
MASCEIFLPTGINEEEKALIDEQLRIAKEENTTLQRINDDVNAHRDRIKQLQSEKKEYTGTLKKDREEFDKLSKQILDREIPFEKLQDAFDRVKALKSRIDAVKKGSKAYNQEFKQEVGELRNAVRSMVDQRKQLKATIKETRSRIIKNFIDDNMELARKNSLKSRVVKGQASMSGILDQSRGDVNSIWGAKQRYESKLGVGTTHLIEDIQTVHAENDIYHESTKQLIEAIKRNINGVAEGLGVFDKYGFDDPLAHPVAISATKMNGILFRGKWKGAGLQNDLLAAYGKENLDKMILERYSKKEMDVPSLENALRDYREARMKGRETIISFNNMPFVSDEAAVNFINKYSDNSLVGNYVDHIRRVSTNFAASKVAGGFIDDHMIKLDRSLSDIQRKRLQTYRDIFFGDEYKTSANQYRAKQAINKIKSWLLLTKPVTLFLSPMVDRAIGEAYRAARYGSEMNMVNAGKHIVNQLAQGFADPLRFGKEVINKGEAQRQLSETAELFDAFSQTVSQRYDIATTPVNGVLSKLNIGNPLINHFEKLDHGLRVVQAKNYANMIKAHSHLELDDLPDFLKNDMVDNYGVTADEWKQLGKYTQDNDIMVSSDFDGDLGFKVAHMEHNNDLAAVPANAIVASEWAYKFTRGNPILASVVTHFWQFTGKLMYFGARSAYQYGGKKGVSMYFTTMAARSFVPAIITNALYNLTTGVSNDDYFDKVSTYTDAAMGVIGRPTEAAYQAFADPSNFGYTVGTPLMKLIGGTVGLGVSGIHSAIDTNAQKRFEKQYFNMFFQLTPFGQTPVKAIAKQAMFRGSVPRVGEKYSDWTKEWAKRARENME